MPRVDVMEGDAIPHHWMVWGEIKPLAKSAPLGQYFALRLPFYSYTEKYGYWVSDNPEPRWYQKVLFYSRYMFKGREGACGEWRICEWPAD